MFSSLRTRLALSNLIVTLAALLVLTVIFGQLVLQRAQAIERADVRQQAASIRADVNRGLNAHTYVLYFATAFVLHDSRAFGKRIIVFTAQGRCLVDSSVFAQARVQNPTNQDRFCDAGSDTWLNTSAANLEQSYSGFVSRNGKTYLVYREPLRIGGHSRGSVVVIASASDVAIAWTTLGGVFLITAVAAGVIWLVLGLYFAYTISRPLHRVTEAARAIARGQYGQRVDVQTGGEIGQLANSFNDMAARVQTSHQLLKDFVANVSHDLRTPLTVISGYAAAIVDGTAASPVEAHEAAVVIADEAGRMQRLVDDLLQLTRLESGLRRFDPHPVALDATVDRILRRIGTASAGRRVRNCVPHELPLALVDEDLFERALLNLLQNALEHTPPTGDVSVSAQPEGDRVRVVVADTGAGIAPGDAERIFERFYRVDRSRSDGHSGLGLPIVKEIAEAHGGSVAVKTDVGRGAAFSFTVPQYRERDRANVALA